MPNAVTFFSTSQNLYLTLRPRYSGGLAMYGNGQALVTSSSLAVSFGPFPGHSLC
ncbi:uncharacterized protein PHACADRAFT_249010 [Phanerochaete carnosa HHB-10118-sp]|uniref:Uncharacterized protein n=1 Tax=Phanerochaete carnosa (strain HHB-10118-sp) TaxID=650164 RepID=K5W4T5_PHACS|nr:uncharacterized protein PHACADRAFT_249010 [Phanerochaete carnosa HHB-10118-sp]EKM58898.1 hypothetical protein PHACADRAFT_249010 [Phanerochaete carnosa HHB-10118-sp]